VSELDTLGMIAPGPNAALTGAWGETMWRCSWLLIAGLVAILPAHADADTAYVSNWKSNTISAIDTDKLQVVKTIEVGQRPHALVPRTRSASRSLMSQAWKSSRQVQAGEQPWDVFIAAP
jgi:YVTN family beta-propeller protein